MAFRKEEPTLSAFWRKIVTQKSGRTITSKGAQSLPTNYTRALCWDRDLSPFASLNDRMWRVQLLSHVAIKKSNTSEVDPHITASLKYHTHS